MTIPQVQQNIVTSQLAEQDLHLNESIEQLVNENRKGEKTDITAKQKNNPRPAILTK